MFDSFDHGPFRVTATDFLLQRGERFCPVCGQAMQPQAEGDALADVCSDHGVWFDQGQWERFAVARNGACGRPAQAGPLARPVVRRRYPYSDDLDVEGRFDLGGGD